MKKIKEFIRIYKNNKVKITDLLFLCIVMLFSVIGAYSTATYIVELIL